MLSNVRPAPRLVFFKAHIKGYTRKDGTFVKPHEDTRTARIQRATAPDSRQQLIDLSPPVQRQTDTAAFKAWFGNSKVVDESGKPLVVYKGMHPYEGAEPTIGFREKPPDAWPGREITSIDRQSDFPAFHGDEPGIKIAGFFGDKKTAASFAALFRGSATYPVYLSLQNPYIVDAKGAGAGTVQFGESGKPWRDALRSGKFDGSIIKNTADEGDVYVALRPEQIKSAISNSGAFDGNDPHILAGGATSVRLTPQEKMDRAEKIAADANALWATARHARMAADDQEPRDEEHIARLKAIEDTAYKTAWALQDKWSAARDDYKRSLAQLDMFVQDDRKVAAAKLHRAELQTTWEKVAKLFDYPVEKVKFIEEPLLFELNGRQCSAAGSASLDTGIINIYPNTIARGPSAELVLAHEIAHQVYQAVSDEYDREYRAVMTEPPVSFRNKVNGELMVAPAYNQADDSLHPTLTKKYPVYAALQAAKSQPQKLAKEDGVTPYSQDWWKHYEAGKTQRHWAMHETFAEIAHLEYRGIHFRSKFQDPPTLANLGVKPAWRKLYRAYQKAHKTMKKKAQRAATP